MPLCVQNQVSVLQQIAMAVRFDDWRQGKMAVMTCYTDVGGSLSELVLSPATLVSTPEKWVEFDKRWSECVSAHRVSALHMKHFAHSRGEFEPWRNDQPKRRRFLNALLWIIEELIEYTAAVSVYTRDFVTVDSQYRLSESMRPYTMGCLGCASRVRTWTNLQGHDKNDSIWIFEKGDRDQSDLRKHWDIAYPDAAVKPIFLKKNDKYLADECRRIRPFEAADLIGYENLHAHRLIERRQGEQVFEDLRKPMQRMFRMAGADKWGYFSEQEMLSACVDWKIPVR
jgi:hypothetical protein